MLRSVPKKGRLKSQTQTANSTQNSTGRTPPDVYLAARQWLHLIITLQTQQIKPSNDQNQITGMESGTILATTTRDNASARASLWEKRREEGSDGWHTFRAEARSRRRPRGDGGGGGGRRRVLVAPLGFLIWPSYISTCVGWLTGLAKWPLLGLKSYCGLQSTHGLFWAKLGKSHFYLHELLLSCPSTMV